MTEEEQLKHNVQQQAADQQFKEVKAYIHALSDAIDAASRKDFWAWMIYLVAWIAWVSSSFFETEINNIFTTLFIVALIYTTYTTNRRMAKYAEFMGAIKILRILGMLPPFGGEKESKKRDVWSEGKELVRSWTRRKETARKEVYA